MLREHGVVDEPTLDVAGRLPVHRRHLGLRRGRDLLPLLAAADRRGDASPRRCCSRRCCSRSTTTTRAIASAASRMTLAAGDRPVHRDGLAAHPRGGRGGGRPGGVHRRLRDAPRTSRPGSATASRPPAPARTASRCCTTPRRTRSARRSTSLGPRHDAAGRHLRHRRGGAARRRGGRHRSSGAVRIDSRRPRRARPPGARASSTRSARPAPGSWSPATSTSTRSPRWPRLRSTATASAPRWSPAAATRRAASSTSWWPARTTTATLRRVAKKSNDKISIGGRKYALRRRDPAGVAEAEVIGIGDAAGRTTATTGALLVPLVRDGEVVGRESLDAARERHAASRAELPLARPAAVPRRAGDPDTVHLDGALTDGAGALRLLLRGARGGHLDDRAAAAGDRGADRRRSTAAGPSGALPVLYLLHGLSDDHTAWLRYTSIERYAAARGLAVVMPAGRPQLLRRRGARPPLLDVPVRGAARVVGVVLPGLRPPRGHLRRRAVHGRLRRAEVGAAPARAVRRGGQPVRGAGRRRARRAPASAPRLFDRVFDGAHRPATTTCSRCSRAPTPTTLPPLYVGCGTEDHAVSTEPCGSSTRRPRPGVDVHGRLPARRARVGAVGRDDPATCSPGCPLRVAEASTPHEARADRGRRPERLLRGRHPAVTGGAEVAADIGELLHHWSAQGPEGARLRRRGRHPRPPRRPRRPLQRRARLRRLLAGALRGRHRRRGVPPQPRPAAVRRDLPQGRARGGLLRLRGARARRRRRWPTGCARTRSPHVDVCGLATDYCVRATALDAVEEGFATTVLLDLCAGVARETRRRRSPRCARRACTLLETDDLPGRARDDGALWLTFNRPEVFNALQRRAGRSHWPSGSRSRPRATTSGWWCVTGTGAGVQRRRRHLRRRTPHERFDVRALDAANRIIRAVTDLDKPVVAAVNGVAAGVGCSTALAADLVVATESASFLLAFARIGLMPDGGTSATVAASIGRARAMRMALLAEPLTARGGVRRRAGQPRRHRRRVRGRARRQDRPPAGARALPSPRPPPRRRSTPPPSTSSRRRSSASAPARRCCCAPTTSPRGCARSGRSGSRSSAASRCLARPTSRRGSGSPSGCGWWRPHQLLDGGVAQLRLVVVLPEQQVHGAAADPRRLARHRPPRSS